MTQEQQSNDLMAAVARVQRAVAVRWRSGAKKAISPNIRPVSIVRPDSTSSISPSASM